MQFHSVTCPLILESAIVIPPELADEGRRLANLGCISRSIIPLQERQENVAIGTQASIALPAECGESVLLLEDLDHDIRRHALVLTETL